MIRSLTFVRLATPRTLAQTSLKVAEFADHLEAVVTASSSFLVAAADAVEEAVTEAAPVAASAVTPESWGGAAGSLDLDNIPILPIAAGGIVFAGGYTLLKVGFGGAGDAPVAEPEPAPADDRDDEPGPAPAAGPL